jgi:hypothetical protein
MDGSLGRTVKMSIPALRGGRKGEEDEKADNCFVLDDCGMLCLPDG